MIPSNAFTVAYRNVPQPMSFTASIEDRSNIENHRWRFVQGTAVTVIDTKVTTLDSLLFGISPNAQLVKRNGNVHDFRRSNLSLSRSTPQHPSRIEVDGDTAYLVLRNAETVLIDAEDVSRVKDYDWTCTHVRDVPTVMTSITSGGRRKKLRLTRLLLNVNPMNNRPIIFLNNDVFDCRKKNLQLVGSSLVMSKTLEEVHS